SLDPAATLRLAAFSINDGVQVSAPVTTTITVVPVNDAPTFIGGGNVTVAEDSGAYSQTWATNISSVEAGQTVTISVSNNNTSLFAAQPTINSSGVLTFTPAPDANGQATVTVTFKDNGGTANGGKDTTTATFTITVTPVNDAPVAAGQNLTTAEDTPLSIILKATDIDSPTLTYTVVTAPAHGTLSGSGANRTYTPAANYNGPDSFTFKANDGALDSNVATINITITPVNDAPVAQDDTYTLNGLQLTVPAPGVLGNDSDVEGDTLHTLLVAQPVHGTLTLNANGSFSYTPAIGFNGVDSFTYKANDGSLDSNAATVTLTIGGNPGQSVALSLSSHSVSEGTSVMGTLTFSRPSAGDVTVTLLSSDNTVATVSTPVTIPAGQTTATFTVTTPRNPLATGPQQVTISANAGDYGTALDNLTVMDNESPTLTLTVAPTAINENYGPAAALATLTRNTPTTQAVRVTLLNSNAKAIKVPPSVVIPAGSASVTFWVAALDNRIGNKAQTAELIARTTGYQDGIAQLSIADNGKVTQDLKLTLAGGTTYTEQVGGQTVRGTLTLSGTPLAKNLTITLVSSEAQRIAVPASVLLRAGQSTVNFTFHVLDNTVADGPHQVWLTARALGFGTAAVLVTVLDNDGPALSLSLPRTSVAENAGSLTATVTRLHVPITDSLTVNLSSSDKTRVAVPTTVTIPAGKAATTFKVTILNNKVVDGNHVVTLTASETGLLAGTSKLTVVDDDKPTPAPRSAVGLSTATVSVANGIQLHFTGALDADSAQDATHYAVMVNGVVVEVQSLAYAAATHTVKLTLTDGAVQVGDSVVVTWQDVQDTQGRSLAGSTGVVTAR
ncbi:MAG: tandem-95 repeat protein, partial [Abitibacteriaceae bacterium]|nr:tandem-95 repeat protein [Abditibacteriaceae bacterium]